MRTRRLSALIPVALALMFLATWPSLAEAQRRRPSRRAVSGVVFIAGSYRAPSLGYWRFDQRYPYPYPFPGPYPRYPYAYRYDEFSAAVRVEVRPREAQVFVDGYFAGLVDDFDGIFQRLHVRPGPHEIVVHLDGYQQIREQLYLNARATVSIRDTMRPLAPGEPAPERPVPSAPPPETSRPGLQPRPEPGRRPEERQPAARPVRFGTLSLMVQPGDAQVLVDGEPWALSPGQNRMTIELPPGRHRVEVRKEGFQTYSEEVLIRPGATLTLNVSLKGAT